jgi:hypothetical protein
VSTIVSGSFSPLTVVHWGETKTWYGIPGDDAAAFESAIKSEAPELFEQQPSLLYQLVTMMNPGRLTAAGVKVVACDQRPNEFVITFPKAYHCGFNHGVSRGLSRPDARSTLMRLSTLLCLIGLLMARSVFCGTSSMPRRRFSAITSCSSRSRCIAIPSRLRYGEEMVGFF